MIEIITVLEGGRFHHDIRVSGEDMIVDAKFALIKRWTGVPGYEIHHLKFDNKGICVQDKKIS